ncbi:SMI1/KNR4 family protein [Thermoactinomyces sp. AMNI-1]|uniref:SMI1/KNR4 family protein n=2 Tax=Thermoactinomyces mirandus TaxID=2756294 RepID=A0A7W2ARE1_9BACL|nr:SMI1/KNR4 family protein [Thermoactinomyces mirandus]
MINWNFYRVIKSNEISQLEKDIQFKLPEDYKSFVSTQGLCEPESDMEDYEIGIEVNNDFFQLSYFYDPDDIKQQLKLISEEEAKLKGKLVPFAIDSGDNWYAFFKKDIQTKIIFIPYGTHLSYIIEGKNFYPIASSFTEFINNLKEFRI